LTDYYLLTKPHCPLCITAIQLIHGVVLDEPIHLHVVDISDQPELIDEYANLVPVLIRAQDDAELKWPFADALERFLTPALAPTRD